MLKILVFYLYFLKANMSYVGCFAIVVLLCKCSVALPNGTVGVIVVFPDHIHLLFYVGNSYFGY